MNKIQIDPEFKALIPPLSPEEFVLLETNILRDGCRDPLTVWGETLLDGHNRHEICTKHGLAYQIFQIDLPDREAAMDWMDANQLGRRNLSREAHDLLLGRRYNRTKKAAHRPEKQLGQNDLVNSEPQNTAARLAVEHGVSEATVKRAGQFAEAVEAQGLEAEAMSGKLKGKKKEVVEAHRKATGKVKDEEHEPLVADGTQNETKPNTRERIATWIPDDASRLWLLAKIDLDKILPNDKSRERVLRDVIEYAQARIDKKK